MMRTILEVIAVTIEDAVIAERGGADRIELIDNYTEGGTTPSPGIIRSVKRAVDIPVYVMIRPHDRGFVYSDLEIDAMVEDAELARKAGADGIVVGALKDDGSIDVETVRRVLVAARLPATFHRAFDELAEEDMPGAFAELAKIDGIERVLTSGGHPNPYAGRHVIAGLVGQDTLSVMPGGGVLPEFLEALIKETGVREVHVGTAARYPHTATSPVSEEHVRKIRALLG